MNAELPKVGRNPFSSELLSNRSSRARTTEKVSN
jgi:hypothetical protein